MTEVEAERCRIEERPADVVVVVMMEVRMALLVRHGGAGRNWWSRRRRRPGGSADVGGIGGGGGGEGHGRMVEQYLVVRIAGDGHVVQEGGRGGRIAEEVGLLALVALAPA